MTVETATAIRPLRVEFSEEQIGELRRRIAASRGPSRELSLPVAFTVFPGEIYEAPPSWAEKVYPNLVYFNEAERGGHFVAWEESEPEVFAQELRAGFESLR